MKQRASGVDGQRTGERRIEGPLIDLARVEELMDHAWPALERQDTGEWTLRAAGGVTQRANSVWPRRTAVDSAAALREAALWHRERRLPLIFQIFEDDRSESLNAVLDSEGFTRQSRTMILVRGPGELPAQDYADPTKADPTTALPQQTSQPARPNVRRTEFLNEPSKEWLDVWWSVDGRGGDPELDVARRILTGCPAVYALVRDDDGTAAAVGRLALVDGWGGLYCMATRRDRRRLGFASHVLDSLLEEGSRRGVAGYWLLVTAANDAARALYRQAGFSEAGRYVYRQAPPRRALAGC